MIELSELQATLAGIIFTVVGALIGALSSVYAARLTAEEQQLYVEFAKFIEAFTREIIALRKAMLDAYKIVDDEAMEKQALRGNVWVKSTS